MGPTNDLRSPEHALDNNRQKGNRNVFGLVCDKQPLSGRTKRYLYVCTRQKFMIGLRLSNGMLKGNTALVVTDYYKTLWEKISKRDHVQLGPPVITAGHALLPQMVRDSEHALASEDRPSTQQLCFFDNLRKQGVERGRRVVAK